MQLVAAALYEHVEQGHRRAVRLLGTVLLSVQVPHLLADLRLLVRREQIRNFAAMRPHTESVAVRLLLMNERV